MGKNTGAAVLDPPVETAAPDGSIPLVERFEKERQAELGELRELPLVSLFESAWNPRKYFSEPKLDELAESIKGKGVTTPLIVRPTNDGFEIGARRFRASKRAGLNLAPEPAPALIPPAPLPAAIEAPYQPGIEPGGHRKKYSKRPPKGRGRPKKAPVSSEPEAPIEVHGESAQKILQILGRAPRTSGELITLSGLTPPTVYSHLTAMRKAGTVVTRDDEADGLKKNFLVK